MRTRRAALALTAALIAGTIAVTLAGCSQGPDTASEAGTGFVAGDGTITLVDPAVRQPAPTITGTTLDGEPFDLAALRGRVVALNVWASWCAPCRAEAPTLERVSRDLGPQGADIIGLNTRDSDASARAFEERFGITYPSVVDRDGRLQLLFGDSLPPQAIPSTVVVDRQGRVAGRILGKASESDLRGLIEPLLAEGEAP